MRLEEWLASYNRIAITGGPHVGKSTLITKLHALAPTRGLLHSDMFKELPWANQSDAVLAAADMLGPQWLMEGVTVARALRHGLQADVVIYLAGPPHTPVSSAQAALAKKVANWVAEVRDKYQVIDVTW